MGIVGERVAGTRLSAVLGKLSFRSERLQALAKACALNLTRAAGFRQAYGYVLI